MFADFLKRLVEPGPAPLPDADARLALTALLVRVARSDESYDEAERARIDRIVATRYGLSPFEATKLRGEAETALGEDFDIRTFHDHMLSAGALPLDILERRMDVWLAEQVTARR